MIRLPQLTLPALILTASQAAADPPRIEQAEAHYRGDGWHISVTLSHPDTGWDHYANGWRVLDATSTELGFRELAHPHVQEQPFTRSLGSVQIPEGTEQVLIQARCSVDGWGKETYPLILP